MVCILFWKSNFLQIETVFCRIILWSEFSNKVLFNIILYLTDHWWNLSFLGKNQLVGDMLCLGGAVLFAIVTVLQELSVKKTDIVEYLGLLGLFGSIVSGIQM